jgi:thioredoxin-related protein
MKKVVLYILLFISGNTVLAQSGNSLLYARSTTLPPFTIIKVPDSTRFEKANLQKNKAVMIMVFSPDCDHCQHEIKEIKSHIKLFKNVQIIMISNLGYHYIDVFYKEFEMAKYPNIIMGMDYRYLLGSFFNIDGVPAVFLYDKNGKFIKAFDRNVPVKTIAAAL